MKILKSIIVFFGQLLQFTLWHAPISVLAIAGLYFTFKLLLNPTFETINITNYGFAIFATLASISFSYEKLITDNPKIKKTIIYCGERFLHSAILFITASIIKYFISQSDVIGFMSKNEFLKVIYIIFLYFPISFFINSVINGIAGLRELNAILFEKKKPFEEIKKLF